MDFARDSPDPGIRAPSPCGAPQRAVDAVPPTLDLSWDGPVQREPWNGGVAFSYVGRPTSILQILDRARLLWPHQPAVIDPHLRCAVSYKEFADMTAGIAKRLRHCGVADGDRVAVLADNAPWVAASMFACALAGAIFVGIDPHAPIPLVIDQLKAARPVLLLSDVLAAGTAKPAADRASGDSFAPPEVLTLDQSSVWRFAWKTPPDPPDATTYMVIATSGSEGTPKGVRISHRGSVHAGLLYAKRVPLTPQDRVACPMPLSYVGGMHSALLPAMLHGAPVVLGSGSHPRRDLEAIIKHRVTFAVATTGWWQAVLRDPGCTSEHLALRSAGVGGAPWDHLREAFSRQLPHVKVFGVYGMTETHGPGIHAEAAELATRPGGVGRCAPCLEAEVRTAEGAAAPPGAEGTLWLRGSLVTSGYAWGENSDVSSPLSGPVLDSQGWLRTGDMACIAPDGWITLLGRRADMINRRGRKISVGGVEQCLRAHPAVEDCAVLGYPRHNGRDAVGACVVWTPGLSTPGLSTPGPSPSGRPSPARTTREQWHDDVRTWVAAHLGVHAAPRVIVTLPFLPRTAAGKTDRAALRRLMPGGNPSPTDSSPAASSSPENSTSPEAP